MLSVLMVQERLIPHSSHAVVGSTAMCWSQHGMGLWLGLGWEWTGEDGMRMEVDGDCAEKPHYKKPMSTKEADETCNFIRIKGEGPLKHTSLGSLSWFWGVQPLFILNS